MWTVAETPPPYPIPGFDEKIRHLIEDGADQAVCGQDVSGARAVRRSWASVARHCPACDQVAGGMGVS